MLSLVVFLLIIPYTYSIAVLNGNWCNELGSNMTISSSQDVITGTYRTAVSGNQGEDRGSVDGKYRVINGGIMLTFSVSWEKSHAITTWIGEFYTKDHDWFCTTWILLVESDQTWNNFLINKDKFTKC